MLVEPVYFLYIAPAFVLGLWAQMRIKSTYATAQQIAAPLSGCAAAKLILEAANIYDVAIEQVQGHLSNHYDPRRKRLRLSPEVYQSRSLAAVGIAAHEAGHAIQHARNYVPLVVRNAAVPLANFGSSFGIFMVIAGAFFSVHLCWAGIILFSGVVFFQVVNLPVEFNASNRAKAELVELGIVTPRQLDYIKKVLNAAALTYVAATLQAILTLLYLIARFGGSSHRAGSTAR